MPRSDTPPATDRVGLAARLNAEAEARRSLIAPSEPDAAWVGTWLRSRPASTVTVQSLNDAWVERQVNDAIALDLDRARRVSYALGLVVDPLDAETIARIRQSTDAIGTNVADVDLQRVSTRLNDVDRTDARSAARRERIDGFVAGWNEVKREGRNTLTMMRDDVVGVRVSIAERARSWSSTRARRKAARADERAQERAEWEAAAIKFDRIRKEREAEKAAKKQADKAARADTPSSERPARERRTNRRSARMTTTVATVWARVNDFIDPDGANRRGWAQRVDERAQTTRPYDWDQEHAPERNAPANGTPAAWARPSTQAARTTVTADPVVPSPAAERAPAVPAVTKKLSSVHVAAVDLVEATLMARFGIYNGDGTHLAAERTPEASVMSATELTRVAREARVAMVGAMADAPDFAKDLVAQELWGISDEQIVATALQRLGLQARPVDAVRIEPFSR